jgi:hypothetical protein
MKAPVQRVWFTGEAMSRDYFGFLQVSLQIWNTMEGETKANWVSCQKGAWIDGGEVGNKVAQCIKSSCPKQPYYPTIKLTSDTPTFIKRQEWL